MRNPATGLSMGLSNLPPGVTDRHIEEAAGGEPNATWACKVCGGPSDREQAPCEECRGYLRLSPPELQAALIQRAVLTALSMGREETIRALRRLDDDKGSWEVDG